MRKPSDICDVLGSLEVGESVLFETPEDQRKARNTVTSIKKQTGLTLVRMNFPAGLRIWCAGEGHSVKRRPRRETRFTVDNCVPVPPDEIRLGRKTMAQRPRTIDDERKTVARENAPVYGMIRKLAVGDYLVFDEGHKRNARAYASRIAKDENRKFVTAKVGNSAIEVRRVL